MLSMEHRAVSGFSEFARGLESHLIGSGAVQIEVVVLLRDLEYRKPFDQRAEGLQSEDGGADEIRTRDLRRDRPAF